jgi:hypothetical protein
VRQTVALVRQELERLGEHGVVSTATPQLTNQLLIDQAATPSADSNTSYT